MILLLKFRIYSKDFVKAVKIFKPDLFMTPTHSIISTTSRKKSERAVKTSREYITKELVEELVENSGGKL